MTISKIPPIPLRTTVGFPLASLTHDTIHQDMAAAIAVLTDTVNGLIVAAGGGSAPAGVVEFYAGTTLPAGNWLWCDGSAVNRTTYSTLFTAIGTTFGVGNGTTTFNLPKMQGRAPVCANPLNSISADTPTLGTYTLGQKYGAEKYNNAAVAVTASVPALSVPHSSLTATLGAISLGSVTATLGSISIGSLTATLGSISLGSVTATLGAISIGSLTATLGAISTAGLSIAGQVACVGAGEAGATAMGCSTLSIAGIIPAPDITVGGSIASPSITVDGAIASPAITLGGTIDSPSISIGGTIASPAISFGGTQTTSITEITGATANIVDLPTVTPELCLNCIIKF